jgi:hypothetical protein
VNVKIVQVIIEVDGKLAHAVVPDAVNNLMVSLLQANEDGKIHAVALPSGWTKVSLAEAILEKNHE